jgi:ribonuclease BN (tRNA processing enzyme)
MQLTFVGTGDAFGSGGRFNTCLHLTGETGAGDRLSWLIDCGATAPLGLARAGIDTAAVSTILVTHFHGDHFAGIPFVLLDGLFRSRRTAPLTLIGPPDIEARFRLLMAAMFPGYLDRPVPFALHFREIAPGETLEHEGATITAFAAIHDPAVGPCLAFRIAVAGKILAISGDTRWTDDLPILAAGADLFVCECYAVDGDIPVHLTYAVLEPRLASLGARRVILTHMGDTMLAAGKTIATEQAHDGLTVTIG